MSPISIYQIVHIFDRRVYHLEAHLKQLFESHYQIFGVGVKVDRSAVENDIREVVQRSHCPKGVSLFVRLTLCEGGGVVVSVEGRSLYGGYTLRCISPRAALVDYSMPNIDCSTSVREQLTQYANTCAARLGADVALRSHLGEVDLCCGAQLFGVVDNRIITSAESHSVEHAMFKETALKMGLEMEEREIKIEELSQLDELFFADHYGITALKSCLNRTYMSIVAGAFFND